MFRSLQCFLIIAFIVCHSTVRAGKDHSSTRALVTIRAEIEGLPDGLFADDKQCQDPNLSGKLIWFKDRKSGKTNKWCARFPAQVMINDHLRPVEGETGSDGLPHIMVRLPDQGDTFTLGKLELTSLNEQEYNAKPVTIRLPPGSFGAFFNINPVFVAASRIGFHPRVCLSPNKDAPCIENRQIQSGSYLLRYQKDEGPPTGRVCNLVFEPSCTEDYKHKSAVEDFNKTCQDELVKIDCTEQRSKPEEKGFGLVQHIVGRKTLPEYFYLCSKTGCGTSPYQVGTKITIYGGQGEYTFRVYNQPLKPREKKK